MIRNTESCIPLYPAGGNAADPAADRRSFLGTRPGWPGGRRSTGAECGKLALVLHSKGNPVLRESAKERQALRGQLSQASPRGDLPSESAQPRQALKVGLKGVFVSKPEPPSTSVRQLDSDVDALWPLLQSDLLEHRKSVPQGSDVMRPDVVGACKCSVCLGSDRRGTCFAWAPSDGSLQERLPGGRDEKCRSGGWAKSAEISKNAKRTGRVPTEEEPQAGIQDHAGLVDARGRETDTRPREEPLDGRDHFLRTGFGSGTAPVKS